MGKGHVGLGKYLMTVGTTTVLVRYVLVTLAMLCLASVLVFGQNNVGIGTATPDASALLHLESTSKGVLIPRLTTPERDAIVLPATGLLIFNRTLDQFQYNFGTPALPEWVSFITIDITGGASSRNFWSLFGNDSINASQHFLGTKNAQPLIIKTDNTLRMTIAANGDITTERGIGIRSGGLDLQGPASPLMSNGVAGAPGQLLVSSGPGATPTWFTDLTLTAGGLVINTRTTVNRPLVVTDSASFGILPKMPLTFGHILVGNTQDIATPVAPGINGALLQVANGTPTWVTPELSAYWSRTGNTGISANDYVGTTDLNDLRLATNGQLRLTIAAGNGKITINDLGGLPLLTMPGASDGVVMADASGLLVKRSVASILALPDNYIYVGDVNNVATPFAPGLDSTFLGIFGGEPTWFSLARLIREHAWIEGGNLAPGSPILGNMATTGIRDLDIRAGGTSLIFLNGTTPQIDFKAPINLSGGSAPFLADGNAGLLGNPLVSTGPGTTPRWTTGLSISDAEVKIQAPALNVSSSLSTFTGKSAFIDSSMFTILPRMPLTFGHILIGNSQDIAAAVPPGINGSILQVVTGNPTWIAPEFTAYWALSGNTGVSASDFLGTKDVNDLRLGTNNQLRMTISGATGSVNIATLAGAGLSGAIPAGEGVVVADASGSLAKREISTLLQLPLNNIYVGNAQNLAAPYAPGPDSSFLGIVGGAPTWVDLSTILSNEPWLVGGNASPTSSIIGNTAATGNRDLDIRAGGTSQIFLNGATPLVDVRAALNLAGSNTPLLTNGIAGGSGNPLVSQGAGLTPRWSSGMTIADTAVVISAPAFNISSNQTTFLNNVDFNNEVDFTDEVRFADSASFTLLPRIPLTRGYLLLGDQQDIATPIAPGINGSVLQVQNGNPTWIAPEFASYWSLSGNSGISATDFLGTRDVNDLRFGTNNQLRMTISGANGGVNIASLAGAGLSGAIPPGEGVVVADASGSLGKREMSTLLVLPQNYIYRGNALNIAEPYAPGPDSTFLGVLGGQPQWISLASILGSASWSVGGNPAPSSPILGNMAATGMRDLDIRAGGSTHLFLNGATPQIDARVPFNLSGSATPLLANNDAGTVGSPLVSSGPGATPTWSTGLSISNTTVTVNADAFINNSLTSLFNNRVDFTDSVKFTLLPEMPLTNGYILMGNTLNIATPLAPGINGSIFQVVGGLPTWISPQSSAFWALSGNAGIGATDFLGTTDANDVRIGTNNQLRMIVSSGNGSVTLTNLAGAPINTTIGPTDGVVVADAAGMLVKRDRQALLEMLGIYGGRFVNSTATEQYSVVITLPSGATLDPQAAITVTPEASTSVSITPFVISGSRTATTFTINFPGGLNPGEAINWMVRNP